MLRGIDLHIPAGQSVAIVGRSGCGKSTLLRLIAGLETVTAGTISLGEDARPEDVRVMFQEPRLLPWARVLSNVEVGLGRERNSPDAQARAESALVEVGLAEKRAQWPAVLSGGQKQRVALARALVSQPRVLAFDEPLGALDALTRISMQRLLERVWHDQGFTAILVTHDVAEAVALADRVLVIEDGRIARRFQRRCPASSAARLGRTGGDWKARSSTSFSAMTAGRTIRRQRKRIWADGRNRRCPSNQCDRAFVAGHEALTSQAERRPGAPWGKQFGRRWGKTGHLGCRRAMPVRAANTSC